MDIQIDKFKIYTNSNIIFVLCNNIANKVILRNNQNFKLIKINLWNNLFCYIIFKSSRLIRIDNAKLWNFNIKLHEINIKKW